jgi:archaellin
MLSKIGAKAPWVRWGSVAALAMAVPLGIPGAASANVGPTANSNSIQYVNVNINPSSGGQAADYENSATAASANNRRTPFDYEFKLGATSAPLVTANNSAEANVSSCRHCGATAIAFQVVLVSKQTLSTLTATDTAQATTSNCTTCNSLAEAFQVVYATPQWAAVSTAVQLVAYQVSFELRMLQYSGLSTSQVQARSTAIVDNFISWLQGNSRSSTGFSPVVNGGGWFNLTGNQPYIGLLSTIQQ